MQAADAPLPDLRQELRLYLGPFGGEPCWLIYDPVRHRYFEISNAAWELLRLWRTEPAAAFLARAEQALARPVSPDEVSELTRFIIANNLALQPPRDDARTLAAEQLRLHRSLVAHVVHGYLFFRIPLFRPDGFLRATLPLVAPLFSRTAAAVVVLISLLGLYLASRQWERFVATFLDFLTLEGALVYALTLTVIKALHELGHAYTATRAGVRVNTMGIAFMVLMPILYTDVTDAWRLRDARQKLAIDAAGIAVELALAGIAIFLWAFLPEGPMQSAAFVTATASLIMGLVVNLNPLMRFDGYYLLADAWRMPNLQQRSNALARWWLRECLFGLRHAPPEPFPPRQRSLLIAYALCVWVYRFFLFLGIALVVYHMFFKVLGVILFAVEIVWFILLPVVREIRDWWSMRQEIVRTGRSLFTLAAVAVALALMIVPWSATVTLQGIGIAGEEARIFAPRPALVVEVAVFDQQAVAESAVLIVLRAPDLEHESAQARRQLELAQIRLARIAGDEADRSNRIVIEGELARHGATLAGLQTEQQRLIVRAPLAGIVRDFDRELQPGEWIDDTTPLVRIVRVGPGEVQGYLKEDDVWRVETGASATFVPEDPLMAARQGRVLEVAQAGARSIDLPYLASVYGGAVATDRSPDNEIRPRTGRHLVRIALDGPPIDRVVRGTLHLAAKPESFAAVLWRRILQVLVRESSA